MCPEHQGGGVMGKRGWGRAGGWGWGERPKQNRTLLEKRRSFGEVRDSLGCSGPLFLIAVFEGDTKLVLSGFHGYEVSEHASL